MSSYPYQQIIPQQYPVTPYQQLIPQQPVIQQNNSIKKLKPIYNTKIIIEKNKKEKKDLYDDFKKDYPMIKNYEKDLNQIIFNKNIFQIVQNSKPEQYITLFISKFLDNDILSKSPLSSNKNTIFFVLVMIFSKLSFNNIKNFILNKNNLTLFMIWFYDFKRTFELLLLTKNSFNITTFTNKLTQNIIDEYKYSLLTTDDFSSMLYNVYSIGMFLLKYKTLGGKIDSVNIETNYSIKNNVDLFIYFYNLINNNINKIQNTYLMTEKNIINVKSDDDLINKLLMMYNDMFYFRYYVESNSFFSNSKTTFCNYFLKPRKYYLLTQNNSMSLWTDIMNNLGKIMLMTNINNNIYIATKPINSLSVNINNGFKKVFSVNKNLLKNRYKDGIQGYIANFGNNSIVNFVYTGSYNYSIKIKNVNYYSLVRYDTIDKTDELNNAIWLLIRTKTNEKVGIIKYNIDEELLDLEIISSDALGLSDTIFGFMSLMELGVVIEKVKAVNKSMLLQMKQKINNIIRKIKRQKLSEIKNNLTEIIDPFMREMDIC